MITVPWPPSINHYFVELVLPAKNGRKARVMKVVGAAGKKFRQTIAQKALVQQWQKWGSARLMVHVSLHAAKNYRYDVDNYAKSLIDALQYINLFDNDNQIDKLVIERGEKAPPKGCAVVTISEIKPETVEPEQQTMELEL